MLKFGIKSAILGSAVYYTIDKGVWKDSGTTATIYDELEKGASPYVGELKKKIPYQLPPLPNNDKISYLFKYYWNSGVKATFQFIVDLPTHTSESATKAYNLISSTLNSEQSKVEETFNKQFFGKGIEQIT